MDNNHPHYPYPIGRAGSGQDPTRPEARPEGVFGDPDPTRAFFGGPEGGPRLTEGTRGRTRDGPDRQTRSICHNLADFCMIFREKIGPEGDPSQFFRTRSGPEKFF